MIKVNWNLKIPCPSFHAKEYGRYLSGKYYHNERLVMLHCCGCSWCFHRSIKNNCGKIDENGNGECYGDQDYILDRKLELLNEV